MTEEVRGKEGKRIEKRNEKKTECILNNKQKQRRETPKNKK